MVANSLAQPELLRLIQFFDERSEPRALRRVSPLESIEFHIRV